MTIHHTIMAELQGKSVEIVSDGRTFSGTLSVDHTRNIVIITPLSSKRYGKVFVDESSVSSVREIFPRDIMIEKTYEEDDDWGDECEDKQIGQKYLSGSII